MKPLKYTKWQLQSMIIKYKDAISLSKALGISRQMISYYLKKYDLRLKRFKNGEHMLMVKDYDAGRTIIELSKIYGCCRKTVHNVIHAYRPRTRGKNIGVIGAISSKKNESQA